LSCFCRNLSAARNMLVRLASSASAKASHTIRNHSVSFGFFTFIIPSGGYCVSTVGLCQHSHQFVERWNVELRNRVDLLEPYFCSDGLRTTIFGSNCSIRAGPCGKGLLGLGPPLARSRTGRPDSRAERWSRVIVDTPSGTQTLNHSTFPVIAS
jgi:hypothetical protein